MQRCSPAVGAIGAVKAVRVKSKGSLSHRVTEHPFFFPGPHATLFGIVHDAAAGVMPREPFVFCHPFAEEKLWTHRVFVTFARQLAALGHPVLRFDYNGHGDSDGVFRDFSVATAQADIGCAIDWLKARTGRSQVSLLGLRLGATLARQVAGTRRDITALILWAPIVDAGKYMQELLRINLTTQMAVYKEIRFDREALAATLRAGDTVNVDGYEIGWSLFEQMSTLKLSEASPFGGPCLALQVDRSGAAAVARDLDALRATNPGMVLRVVQEEPFWKEIDRFYDAAPNLAAETLSWMNAQSQLGAEPLSSPA